ncbi:MAG: hypothetical protein UT02_C0030G0003 [Parcubacteria group bacterium GW2011_GWC2_38_7]|nr:MAG: hypothetical protein UT02_C0030G0003 [Parcubacteria group bacterium GW2011_GWC2_38_7]
MQIRELTSADLLAVSELYQNAFAGSPWFQTHSLVAVMTKLSAQFQKPGFRGIVLEEDGKVVGAHWHDILSWQMLEDERGPDIAKWLEQGGVDWRMIIWERELLVHQDYQRRGFATALRREFVAQLNRYHAPIVVLTRLRPDNPGTIKSAEKVGFKFTGVHIPSTDRTQFRQYWALFVG